MLGSSLYYNELLIRNNPMVTVDNRKIWKDGHLIDWPESKVHILTHALHYGTNAFEGIRCYSTSRGPAIFRLDDHIKRFFFSASVLDIKIKFSEENIKSAVKDCIEANGLEDCYIRPIAYFGQGNLGLIPDPDSVSVAIACWPWVLKEGADKGVKVKISKYIRPHPRSICIEAKIGGHYVNSVMASQEARKSGFDEALLLDHEGFVAEGPGENIFMIRDGILVTPARGSILSGITRDTIMILARDMGLRVIEKKIKPEELQTADESFFVGTAVEVWPILQINDQRINSGKIGDVTLQLMADYKQVVKGENNKYLDWLSML